ncbi:MAG: fumarate hydratase C-terminal domain-containing protein [bacterium]
MLKIKLPSEIKKMRGLKTGNLLLASGHIYTARDQAHKRLAQAIRRGKALPFNIRGQVIYYCGPTPNPKGKIVGSCGPTTSSRMDVFTPALLKAGIIGMIGKGRRSTAVVEAIKKYKA